MRRLLDGVFVLSLAEQYPGPFATLLLADLGAEVLIVERPHGGDPSRGFAAFHASLNRNKKSLALDLKSVAGKRALERLAVKADVLVEGYRPGTMKRLGLGWDELSAINPRLVYASISGFGQSGPLRDRPVHDFSLQAVAGMFFRGISTGVPPQMTDHAIADLSAGMFTAFGIAAALTARDRTGKGSYLDVAMADSLVSLMTMYLGPHLNGTDSAIGVEPAHGGFICADGKMLTVSIAFEDHFWVALCGCVGLNGLASLSRTERLSRRQALSASLADRIVQQPLTHWAAVFDEAAIPWGPVQSLDEVGRDPQFAARRLFVKVGGEWHVRQPLVVNGEAHGPTQGVPRLGEHTREMLLRSGFNEREIAELIATGVASEPVTRKT